MALFAVLVKQSIDSNKVVKQTPRVNQVNQNQEIDNKVEENGEEDGTSEKEGQKEKLEPEIIASDIDTSNWQTYRNEEYGFEVKYPKEYDVRDREYTGSNPDILKIVHFRTDTSSQNDYGISVIVKKMPEEGLDYKKITEEYNNNKFNIKIENNKIIVNKKEINQIKNIDNPIRDTYFESESRYYIINFIPANVISSDIYNSFLLSFKILN